MNPLTLGLLAAALTVVIVKVARRGRGRQLQLPMTDAYMQTESPPPSGSNSSSNRSSSGGQESATRASQDAVRQFQVALNNFGVMHNRLNPTQTFSWVSSRALTDGLVGPVTERAFADVSRQVAQYYAGYTFTSNAPGFGQRQHTFTGWFPLRSYLERTGALEDITAAIISNTTPAVITRRAS